MNIESLIKLEKNLVEKLRNEFTESIVIDYLDCIKDFKNYILEINTKNKKITNLNIKIEEEEINIYLYSFLSKDVFTIFSLQYFLTEIIKKYSLFSSQKNIHEIYLKFFKSIIKTNLGIINESQYESYKNLEDFIELLVTYDIIDKNKIPFYNIIIQFKNKVDWPNKNSCNFFNSKDNMILNFIWNTNGQGKKYPVNFFTLQEEKDKILLSGKINNQKLTCIFNNELFTNESQYIINNFILKNKIDKNIIYIDVSSDDKKSPVKENCSTSSNVKLQEKSPNITNMKSMFERTKLSNQENNKDSPNVQNNKNSLNVQKYENYQPSSNVTNIEPMFERTTLYIQENNKDSPNVQNNQNSPNVQNNQNSPNVQNNQNSPNVQNKQNLLNVENNQISSNGQNNQNLLNRQNYSNLPYVQYPLPSRQNYQNSSIRQNNQISSIGQNNQNLPNGQNYLNSPYVRNNQYLFGQNYQISSIGQNNQNSPNVQNNQNLFNRQNYPITPYVGNNQYQSNRQSYPKPFHRNYKYQSRQNQQYPYINQINGCLPNNSDYNVKLNNILNRLDKISNDLNYIKKKISRDDNILLNEKTSKDDTQEN